MHIAEINLYGSIHKFNFSHGIFRFFQIAYFGKNNNGINSVDYNFTIIVKLYVYFNIYIFPWEIFPMGNFSRLPYGNFFPRDFFPTGKKSYGIFQKWFQLHKCHVTVFRTVL